MSHHHHEHHHDKIEVEVSEPAERVVTLRLPVRLYNELWAVVAEHTMLLPGHPYNPSGPRMPNAAAADRLLKLLPVLK